MFAEAATSETAGAFTDATMHATGVKHVLQAGVFDEADGASMSSGKAGGPIRAPVCLFGTFVSDFRIDFRFRRYKSTLVSGFDFRIGLSFTKVKKKYFRFPFPKQRIARDTKVGWVTKVKSQQKPTSDFRMDFRIRLSYNELLGLIETPLYERRYKFVLKPSRKFHFEPGGSGSSCF